MAEHPNVERMREAYEAFGKGDLEAIVQLWAEDIRWHEPGGGPLAGTYEGPQAIFEMFGRTMDMTEGSFRVEPVALFADDSWGVALVRSTAHRDGRTLDVLSSHVVRFADGRVAEFWDTETDPAAVDAFFG